MSAHLIEIGNRVQEGWRTAAEESDLSIHVSGIPPLSHFEFQSPGSGAVRTLFTQILLERGYLATNSFYATNAHQIEHVEGYIKSVRDAFGILADVVHAGDAESKLKGPVAHSGFQRLT